MSSRSHRSRSRARHPGEALRSAAGTTFVELLVAAGMAVVVIGSAMTVLTTLMNDQPKVSARDFNIQKARVTLDRLTREIRQGIEVEQATAATLVLRTYTRRTVCGQTGTLPSGSPATPCRVTYACISGTCTRTEAQEDGSGPGSAVKAVQGLSSDSVFSYSPSTADATYVRATLVLPNPSGGGSLTIGDGASLRNATLTN